MSSDDIKDVIVLFVFVAFSFTFGWLVGVTQENEGKNECERNLPRSQQCVIKWVPEEKK